MRRLVVAGLIVMTTFTASAGKRYRLSVTRKDSNFYRIDGTDFYVRTRNCYEYAYSQEAVLVWEGRGSYSNKLIFINTVGDPTSCDVEAMLVETDPS